MITTDQIYWKKPVMLRVGLLFLSHASEGLRRRLLFPLLVVLFAALVPVWQCVFAEGASNGHDRPWVLINQSYETGSTAMVGVVDEINAKKVRVKLVDNDEHPVPDQWVYFSIGAVPPEARHQRLSVARVQTDSQGIAETEFFIGSKPGTYSVTAYQPQMTSPPLLVKVKAFSRDWSTYLFMGLLGGIGMFLYGMVLGSRGLQKAAGKQMKAILGKLTENRFSGLLVGTVTSAILQSSSATTVLIVSLVSASLLTINQALAVVIGANVGTSITIHLIAFKITNYALLMIGIGFLLRLFSRKKKLWYFGQIIMGFGFVFYGMHIMSEAVEPLKTFPQFTHVILSMKNYPFLVGVAAALFTAIIQASGVTIGLAIVLARQGLLGLDLAVPIIIGAHVGTTSTALISSLSLSKDSRRVALFHFIFNAVGAVVCFFVREPLIALSQILTTQAEAGSVPRMIANANMLFMMGTALLFIFFTGPMAVFLGRLFRDSKEKGSKEFRPKYLSESLLSTPELALDHALREILRMASFADRMLDFTIELLLKRNEELIDKIVELDDKIDVLEQALRDYLTAFNNRDHSPDQAQRAVALIYIADDIEHIGDVLEIGVLSNLKKLIEQDIHFSKEGLSELQRFHSETQKIFRVVVMAIRKEDRKHAAQVLEMKAEISVLERSLRKSHLDRLLKGTPESIESGTIHMDLLGEMRRIGTLSSKIAHTIIEEF